MKGRPWPLSKQHSPSKAFKMGAQGLALFNWFFFSHLLAVVFEVGLFVLNSQRNDLLGGGHSTSQPQLKLQLARKATQRTPFMVWAECREFLDLTHIPFVVRSMSLAPWTSARNGYGVIIQRVSDSSATYTGFHQGDTVAQDFMHRFVSQNRLFTS